MDFETYMNLPEELRRDMYEHSVRYLEEDELFTEEMEHVSWTHLRQLTLRELIDKYLTYSGIVGYTSDIMALVDLVRPEPEVPHVDPELEAAIEEYGESIASDEFQDELRKIDDEAAQAYFEVKGVLLD